MSLLSWLKKGSKSSLEVPNYPGLPNLNDEVNEEQALACESANKQIQEEMWNTSTPPASKKKRTTYNKYDRKTRAHMAKYADLHGLTAAARHFSMTRQIFSGDLI